MTKQQQLDELKAKIEQSDITPELKRSQATRSLSGFLQNFGRMLVVHKK